MYEHPNRITESKPLILHHVAADPLGSYAAVLGVLPSEFAKKGTEFYLRCPLHEDRNPSFRINVEKRAWRCDPCNRGGDIFDLHAAINGLSTKTDFSQIVNELAQIFHLNTGNYESCGIGGERRLVAAYRYVGEDRGLVFEVCRFERLASDGKGGYEKKKEFLQRHRDADGEWIWHLGRGDRKRACHPQGVSFVLYRLPELLAADAGEIAFIVEGEKEADLLAKLGLIAITNPGGAGKWSDEYNEYLRGRAVVILPDNDHAGEEHARQIGKALFSVAQSVKIVRLSELPEKGDVSDWLSSGGTKETLLQLVEAAPIITAEDVEQGTGSSDRPRGFRTVEQYLAEVKTRAEKKASGRGFYARVKSHFSSADR